MITSLEAIAQKLEDDRKNKLETILSVSGSQAITKNEYGITIVENTNVASSLVFKELNKNKYDTSELLKAVDINVIELKPDIPVANRNLVPKPLYDEQVTLNDDLRAQVESLTNQVSALNTQIDTLKNTVQTEINSRLSIEQTNDALVNQLATLTQTIDEFALQIQTAIQKSVDESILRTSLQAQNTGFKAQIEALIKQIDSLNSIIEGLQSQLGAVQNQQSIVQGTRAQAQAAGADVINEVAIVKLNPKSASDEPPIKADINAKGGNRWVNGSSMSITNNDKQPINIEISVSYPQGARFFRVSETSFSVTPGASKDIQFTIDENAVSGFDARKTGWFFGDIFSNSKDYAGGTLTIKVGRVGGATVSKGYEIKLSKKHPKSF
jgi:hypothetical protein